MWAPLTPKVIFQDFRISEDQFYFYISQTLYFVSILSFQLTNRQVRLTQQIFKSKDSYRYGPKTPTLIFENLKLVDLSKNHFNIFKSCINPSILQLESSPFESKQPRYWVKHVFLQLSSNLNVFCVIYEKTISF